MNNKITNTAKDEVKTNFLLGAFPGGIEAQEERGQAELVNSEQLPTDVRSGKEKLEAAGVVFGPPLASDPLFCDATLPKGWSKQATEHSMWSNLVDETGKVRAVIFYKAAFYDRAAFMSVRD